MVYVFFFIPETKGTPSSLHDGRSRLIGPGHSLEEIDELYRSKTPAWKTSNWQPSIKRAAIDEMEDGTGARRASETTMVGTTAKPETGHVDRTSKIETGHVEGGDEKGSRV